MASTWSEVSFGWRLSYRDAGVSPQKYNALARKYPSQRAVNAQLRAEGYELYAPSDSGWRKAGGPMGKRGWRSKEYRSFAGAFAAAERMPYHTLSYLTAYGMAATTSPKDEAGQTFQWRAISDSASPDDYDDEARARMRHEMEQYFIGTPRRYAVWVIDV